MSTPNAATYSQINWRKSSYSGGANDCVEIADLGRYIIVRDSKNPHVSPVTIQRVPLGEFIDAVKNDKLRTWT